MSILAGNIKSLITVKIKPRHDGYTDQVSRIFVTKIFVVSGLILGVDWFNDNINCVLPENTAETEKKYAESACWIKGFYVYPHMETLMSHSLAYGIPQYAGATGIFNGSNELCEHIGKHYKVNEMCVPMKKFYFAHYQWMPFVVVSMAVFFYLPYVLFRVVNNEMISLCALISQPKVEVEEVIRSYFDHSVNSVKKMKLRVFFNFVIKLIYLLVNIVVFALFDNLLDSRYVTYGTDWLAWSRIDNSIKMDYPNTPVPRPGDRMFPAFAFCDYQTVSKEAAISYENRQTVLCEISSNVLYQYVMLLIWFVLVASTLISALGIVVNILSHVLTATRFLQRDVSTKLVYKHLTLRECEYCEKIRRNNLHLFGKVVRKLLEIKGHPDELACLTDENNLVNHRSTGRRKSSGEVTNNFEMSNPFKSPKVEKKQQDKKAEKTKYSKFF